MDLKNGQPADAIGVRCHALDRGVSYSVSDDGSTAMFVFEDSDAQRVAFTVRVDRLKAIRSMLSDAIDAVERQGAGAGQVLFKRPKKYSIGSSDRFRGHIAIQFEPGAEDEAVFLLDDKSALGFADAIRRDVFDRMTTEDKRNLSLALPSQRIIRPRG